jgi:hypothetical protein
MVGVGWRWIILGVSGMASLLAIKIPIDAKQNGL